MSALIVRNDEQLRKVERSIAAIEARPASERERMKILLAALRSERAEILRYPLQAGARRQRLLH